LRYSSHYYDIAHCSKVVKPGAKRIKSSGYTANGLSYEAFQNPDGSFAVLALNKSGEDIQVSFQGPNKGFRFTIPATSITSLRWSESE
jgi:glucosylceramidase